MNTAAFIGSLMVRLQVFNGAMGGQDTIGHAMPDVLGALAASGQEQTPIGAVVLLEVPPGIPGKGQL
jgi:hypothetical protein